MSPPRSVALPEAVRPVRLPAAHGPLAALRADPPAGAPRRGWVLMAPGYTGSKEDFLAVLEPLAAAGHPVVALDQRGQHESPHAPDPACYSVPALAEDLLAVAAGLAAGPVHLVGHSFGGLVARVAAIARPEQWRSLVLVGSGPAAVPPPRAERVRLLLAALPQLDLATIWAMSRQLDAADGIAPGPPEVEALLHRRWHGNDPVGLARMGEALLAEPDQCAELAATGRPTLVLFGAADDTWEPAVQREMAARLHAAVRVIDGAGHSPAAEQPAATAAALLEWWHAVEAR